MPPGLALGRFTRQLELGDADAIRLVVEDHLDPHADGHVLLFFRLQIAINQIGGDAETVLGRGLAALFVQFHQHDGKGRHVTECGYDGMRNDLIAVDGTLAAHLNPIPFQGRAPRAARSRLPAQQAAGAALLDHQPMFTGGLEVAAVFAVVVGDVQTLASIFIHSHVYYLLMIRALPTAGVPHPIFILISASLTCRQPPSE